MKKFLVLMLVTMFMALGSGVALGADAGTLTLNSDSRVTPPGSSRAVRVIEWDWLSDASGDCDVSTSKSANASGVTGTVVGLHAVPEAGGTIPTDDYDVTVIDGNGVDVLNGAGANLNQLVASAENYRFPADFLNTGPIVIVDRELTLVVANGGNAKGGVIRIYILLP